MSVAIKIENLSKQYNLGTIGTGTVGNDLNRFIAKVRGKEDPNLKIGETNDRTKKGDSSLVWALKDINFEVQQGEILGVIGKNGAGKSTLLKILSKVTGPTTGSIKARGRIAALLEVGTGFHPELTGRENVFLNGTILGMTKVEIRSKLDEIVAFAGIERYLDTPVKRYSSGMMVRLGFAVAAHLEPEILIVDEVLAVGDAEFQKKAIGKMKDVSSKGGRTVLFVSHNMGSIINLCDRTIVLKDGGVVFDGDTLEAIDFYLNENTVDNKGELVLSDSPDVERSGKQINSRIISVKTHDSNNRIIDSFLVGNDFYITIEIEFLNQINNPEIGFAISNMDGCRLHHLISLWDTDFGDVQKGIRSFTAKICGIKLYPGQYTLAIWTRLSHVEGVDDFVERALTINIQESDKFKNINFDRFLKGGVLTEATWEMR